MRFINISKFPKDKIYVLIDKEYRKFIIKKSIERLKSKNFFELSLWINKTSKTKFNGGDIKYWVEGERLDKRTGKIHPKFMPLWLVLKLSKLNNIDAGELQKNIISYRSGGSGLMINAPKLPIKVTPELDSIVIHMFGDGAAGDFTPSYTQKNKDSFNNFIKKLESCFGTFEKSIYFTQGKHQIKFPKAITDIISDYYVIDSYHSHKARVPVKILKNRNKDAKLACILAFLIDEGGIRDVISLYSSNFKLLSDIRQLVLDCGYTCSKIKANNKSNAFSFNISNKNLKRIYNDIAELSKKFSTCNLSFKKEQVEFILNRQKIKNPKKSKITEKAVLDLLKNNKLTAQQISKLINYAYCTIIHTLERLSKENKVQRNKISNKTYLWELTEFTSEKK